VAFLSVLYYKNNKKMKGRRREGGQGRRKRREGVAESRRGKGGKGSKREREVRTGEADRTAQREYKKRNARNCNAPDPTHSSPTLVSSCQSSH
jgi:hypothetical protein